MELARRIEPEWLDELPAEDPRAMRSRRDLKRVNRWMLQSGIMARLLARDYEGPPPRTILELGAGDGTFMLSVVAKLARRWKGMTVTLLDRQDIVTDETRRAFRSLGWDTDIVCADVFEYLQTARPGSADIVTANLFLHHFEPEPLAALLAGVAPLTNMFAACEPWRAPSGLIGSRLLWAIGCNDVSRHDALASVRAGFRDAELSALWPSDQGWEQKEGPSLPFTHCFVARRTRRVTP
jgi:hypothetical protein